MGDVVIDFQAVFGGIYDALADRVVCDNYLNQEEELINFIEEQVDIRGDAIENEIGTYACFGSYDSLRGTEKLSVGIVLEEGQEMYFLKNGKDRKENGIGIIIVVISFLIVIFIVGFWFGKQKGLNEKEDGVYGKTLEEADENENLGDIAEEMELLKGEKEESVEVWSQEKLNEMLIAIQKQYIFQKWYENEENIYNMPNSLDKDLVSISSKDLEEVIFYQDKSGVIYFIPTRMVNKQIVMENREFEVRECNVNGEAGYYLYSCEFLETDWKRIIYPEPDNQYIYIFPTQKLCNISLMTYIS